MFFRVSSIRLCIKYAAFYSIITGIILLNCNCFNPDDISVNFDTKNLRECVKNKDKCLIVLSVVTKNISSDSYPNYSYSLNKYGYDFHIIGTDLGWNGWITRGAAMRAAMNNLKNTFNAEELKKILVISSDTGDVLVQKSPDELLALYKNKLIQIETQFPGQLETQDLVIVGGEWHCGENCEQNSKVWFDRLKIDQRERYFRYPQGGFLMGSPIALHNFYEYTVKFMNLEINDDQIAMGKFAINYPSKIYIDYKQELVATIVIPGHLDEKTGLDLDENKLYTFSEKGLSLGDALRKKIGSVEKIYPAFLHVPNNMRNNRVREYWDKLVAHLKMTAWKN